MLALHKLADTAKAYFSCRHLVSQPLRTTRTAERHLLLLAWAYPPEVTGGVYRPISLAREAKRQGWKVTVICGPAPEAVATGGAHLDQQVAGIGKVIRLKPSALDPSHKLFVPKISGGFLNLLETIKEGKKLLADDPPSVIVASGPAFHNFAAARVLSRLSGAPFVIDYRDEWTECPFDFVEVGNTDRAFEAKCLASAHGIVFTTQSHLEHQSEVFQIRERNRISLIPNGWEPDDTSGDAATNPLPAAGMRIAFVGHLGEHTLPQDFLECIGKMLDQDPALAQKLRVAFVGSKSDTALKQLQAFPHQDVLEIVDAVPKPVALKIMQDAAGILLINEDRLHRYRPGKLYDYIAMKTPVIVYGAGGEVDDVVTSLDAGVVVPVGSPVQLRLAVGQLKDIKDRLGGPLVESWLRLHTRASLAGRFVALLDSTSQLRH